MALLTLVPPAVEPVTVAELKSYLHIDAGDVSNDDVVSDLNVAARSWAEQFTRRRFVTQQIAFYLDNFPRQGGTIPLPYSPVQSIDLFRYVDGNGVQHTLTPTTDYLADLKSRPARVSAPYGKWWPVEVSLPLLNAVEIHYTCGYGDTGDSVPGSIRAAIRMLVAEWYDERIPKPESSIPKRVKDLLMPSRDFRL